MLHQILTPECVLLFCGVFSLICYFYWMFYCGNGPVGGSLPLKILAKIFISNIKSLILYLLMLIGFAPILKTLTIAVSTDTIYAMTFFLLLFNSLFYDYKYSNVYNSNPKENNSKKYILASSSENSSNNTISLNFAICSAACLGSRLSSLFHVFSFTLFAVDIFVLYSSFVKFIQDSQSPSDSRLYIFCTVSHAILNCAAYMYISQMMVFVYLAVGLFVCFLCPAWLIYLEKYKNEIHGPWDEAIIILPVQ
eukprot:Sdes_comp18540_c0_seq1m8606